MRKQKKRIHRPERDRAIFEVLRAIKDMKTGQIARRTYVAASTINNWRNNKTKYPQHHTLAAVARVAGLEYRLVPIKSRSAEDERRAAIN